MKKIVTFETSKKLEATGFKRPKPEVGQFWYNPNGRLYHITATRENDIFVKRIESAHWSKEIVIYEEEYGNWFYAATATDILAVAPILYLQYLKIGDCWGCFTIGKNEMVGIHPDNPANAVAEAFLSQSKQ